MSRSLNYDVLIIGSGAAGLALALSLANYVRIALFSKEDLTAGSSQHAQGGLAAALSAEDSIESHIQDTLNAGAGLCNPVAVEFTVSHAKSAVEWLVRQGVQFTPDITAQYPFHLTQEGGHSHRRILHAADRTGAVVVKTLLEQVHEHPNIDCYPHHIAIDLLIHNHTCFGASFYDSQNDRCILVQSRYTVLSTGGASTVYLHTSNPNRTTGDGIAMAWRAGCRMANLEFNQFHPTCLYHPLSPRFLITEVVRGEGGHLILPNGRRFMQQYDPRGEMAPRDIVSYAIHQELNRHKIDCVYLDISHRSSDFIKTAFPTIYERCLSYDIDITHDPIPVVPAAHYTCGGVMADLNGQTDIMNLYAIGEVAHTGLHGANRMASNSLLECVVFAASAAQHIQQQSFPSQKIPHVFSYSHPHTENNIPIESWTQTVRTMMWEYAGIVRSNAGLMYAETHLEKLQTLIDTTFSCQKLSKEFIELRNLIQVAILIIKSAKLRKESRGVHFNIDYPETLTTSKETIIKK